MVTKEYLAGIFDGEGCLYIMQSRRASLGSSRCSLKPMVVICNTCLPLLEAIQADWGGRIIPKRLEYYKGRKARQSYELYWHDQNKVAALLGAIQPFLIVKKAEVDLFISDFVPTIRNATTSYRLSDGEHAKRVEVRDKLRVMKKVEYPAA